MGYRAAVIGASGYTGAELLRLLDAHPRFEAVAATSREFEGRRVTDIYPNLTTSLVFTAFDPGAVGDADIVFLALPHGASMAAGAALQAAGTRVIDLSADFRLQDAGAYPTWFGREHVAPSTLGEWVYGLPELHRARIAGAHAVANPGCYPTAALLALAPLVRAGAIDATRIVVSAASGVSGAGRGVNPGVHFSHVDANLKAYGYPGHKHTPEIEQELATLAGAPLQITFVPHLVPMPRGLLATCIAPATGGDPATILAEAYAEEPFVRALDAPPETKYTHGSNRALVHATTDARTNTVIATCAIDNLGKGAAGQAIQNANLMLGLPETLGLTGAGVYP
jgi:N-acetyl-gamma-glutamyl-phosphate reductase